MKKKMLVECDPHETRIAVLEDDRVYELFLERHHHLDVVGNIYKGRVKRVLPGMQAAFVDIGLDRDAFLYVNEVTDPMVEEMQREEMRREEQREKLRPEEDETAHEDFDIAALHRPIEELLRVGQELVVQVVKDAIANKGARLTTQITLPGRHLVLLPGAPHVGVSRRIEDEAERQRLRDLLDELRPESDGIIVRTAGAQAEEEEFKHDLAYLGQLWKKIEKAANRTTAPALLHRDLDVALRVVRDEFSQEFNVLWIDDEETYERIIHFVDEVQPELLPRVKLHRGSGLLDRFGVDAEIEAALRSKVMLKSGGYLVIQSTEALVAIDVNTGRYVGHHNLEETVLHTNLEAVREIVRQIRLRNLGGIIVLDLIDMTEEEHRDKVFEALENELLKDRAKYKVLSISEFGLVELTRKRTRPSLERLLTQPCPYCSGVGRIKSPATISLELRRQLLQEIGRYADREVMLRVHPDIASTLQRSGILDELEQALGSPLVVQSDPDLRHERFNILEV